MRAPEQVLHGASEPLAVLPVCDHYAGTEPLMRKSLARLQAAGPCPSFDVTLDAEDGAAVGAEEAHARLIAQLIQEYTGPGRIGVRVHPVQHPAFMQDLQILLGQVGAKLAYIMLPKASSAIDVGNACETVRRLCEVAQCPTPPIHVLIESHGALREVFRIAAHPQVESLSFGLMDFVSAHRGAIGSDALTAEGQMAHPLIVRAKLEIAAACHAYGKVASHSVVTELAEPSLAGQVAQQALEQFGYQRMWSIHPAQIEPIVQALQPTTAELERAALILLDAQRHDWAPVRHLDQLHDRASYRHFWTLLKRAHALGLPLPAEAATLFEG